MTIPPSTPPTPAQVPGPTPAAGPTPAPALVCRDTGERYALDAPFWNSPRTGGLLDLIWPSAFPLEAIARRPPTLWRYREALPIPPEAPVVSLGEPLTPLLDWPAPPFVHAPAAGRRPRHQRVLLKLDNRFASGSYKDRGAAILLSHLHRLRPPRIVEDSSGNAGAAIAMYAAAAGIPCDIYVPAQASPAKLIQARLAGANLISVPGPRQAAADAALAAAREGAYYASHAWNPFFFHGTKTFAFELAEQLGWQPPDAIVIPTGNGTLLLGASIGFAELLAAGVIRRLPRLFAVQTQACAPLAESSVTPAPTIAEGIAIPRPIRHAQIQEAIAQTGGGVLTVPEPAILEALAHATRAGLFIEPTCATALAALALHEIPGDLIVLPITGHGLKAPQTLERLLLPAEI